MTDAPTPGQDPAAPNGAPQYPAAGANPPAYNSAPGAPAYGGGYATAPKKTLGIISLVLGIVGLVVGPFTLGVVGLASIAAVVLGFLSRSREGAPARGFWITGLILGFVGIAVALIVLIVSIVALVAIGGAYGSYGS